MWGPFQPSQPSLASSVCFPGSHHVMAESKEMCLKAPANRFIKGRICFKLLWAKSRSVTWKNHFTWCFVLLWNMISYSEGRTLIENIWKQYHVTYSDEELNFRQIQHIFYMCFQCFILPYIFQHGSIFRATQCLWVKPVGLHEWFLYIINLYKCCKLFISYPYKIQSFIQYFCFS